MASKEIPGGETTNKSRRKTSSRRKINPQIGKPDHPFSLATHPCVGLTVILTG